MLRRRLPMLLIFLPLLTHATEPVRPAWNAAEGSSPGGIRLDRGALTALLAEAPREFTDAARERRVVVELPRPDGRLVRFQVEESPILSPAMTSKYGIRTYAARGIDEPSAVARFDIGPGGFHALVLASSGSFEIRPDGDDDRYRSAPYADKALNVAASCVADDLGRTIAQPAGSLSAALDTQGVVSLYRLAVSATGEFTAQNGNTRAAAFGAITTVINGVNTVYRRDLGIHLTIVDGDDQLVLTSPNPLLPTQDLDCTGGNNCLQVDCLLTGNACLVNALIGIDNYDVAMVFDATNASGGAAGRAELSSVCNSQSKARGATGGTSIELTAHEMGHMFGGHHTFNNNNASTCGNPGQWDAAYAFEPGSGSTLMSYAGTCGWADLQNSRDLQFHADNLRDMLGFIQTGGGSACVDHAFSGNYGPIVQSSPGTHTVPKLTPFVLSVGAYDPNGDTVTYSFDESDTGTPSPPEADDGTRPIYRTYFPSPTPSRSFPREDYVLSNDNVPPAEWGCGPGTDTCLTGETLHSTARTMDFAIALRDGVDGVTLIGATVIVDGGSGPFKVTQPDAVYWTEGTQHTVTWNTANTQNAPVSCSNVRILLSVDNGATYPYVLASSTPNDGSQTISLPFVSSLIAARIKVEAVGNIFYDVSPPFGIDPFGVTNTNDSGRGSLRQAILDANTYPTGATIPFSLPGSGVRTIQVLSSLPPILKPMSIDAWDLGGPSYTGPPLLELSGSSCPTINGVPCDGLSIGADNVNVNGLVIRNFSGNGIVMGGVTTYASSVQNCYIGTDATGSTAAPNGLSGILVNGGYGNPLYGNYIGNNLISGNLVGITVNGAGANGTAIMRNKIGTNAAGTARVPNLDDGVRIIGAPNTLIGGPGDGNVISGNGTVSNGFVNRYADAIDVSGAGAAGTIIQGNYLGLDVNAANGLFNTVDNIHVTGAPNTRIGGTAAGAGNVIGDDGTVNYNFSHCVHVEGAGATGLVVQGNKIGTNLAGTVDRGCRGAGILIDGAPGAQIGGTVAAARNLISGNNNYGGVVLNNGAGGALVQGNYIGTDVTGTSAIPNGAHGVSMNSGGNTIGGTAPGAGNVISGNSARGIDLAESGASNNTIQGNFIGTNAAGTAGIANVTYGIFILRAQNNLIGGTVAGARNLISGNGDSGIYIAGSDGAMCNGNVIQGNTIGTDITGTTAIGNAMGVNLYYVANVTVGGPAAGAGNLISGSRAGNGVRIYSFGLNTSGIVVQGNRIGTNAAVNAKLGNNGEGIWATITGTASILGNVVSGNALQGIYLNRGSFTVQGNWVGTDATGTLNLGNAWSGIYSTSQEASLIGGTAPGEGNVVAFSGAPNTGLNFAGVSITASAARQTVRGNRVFSNPGLGIDLHVGGVAGNDACDADTGANAIQNFPVVGTAFVSGSSTRVIGTLNSTASTQFMVDFYSSPACDSFGYGEGSTYLGSTTVTTDGSCGGSFNVLMPVPASGVLTATATDPLGNTSEFSACGALTPGPVAEVGGVSWASKAELTWSSAAGASSYRVLRGSRATLSDLLDTDIDSCTRYSGSALTSGPVLTEDPGAAGSTFYWYLVVGSNGADDGPFGPATAGQRAANSSGTCP